MKKETKKIIAIILLVVLFFSFSIIITFDSAHYMEYVKIFNGDGLWADWDIVRGIVYPLSIFFTQILFGKNVQGLLITNFLIYFILIKYTYKIISKITQKEWIKVITVLALCVINPIIFGFYHVLLTEGLAITLAIVGCYYAWEFCQIDYKDNKKKYIIYTLLFSFLIIFSWHLKQPYISTSLFTLLIASFISIIKRFNLKNILSRCLTIIFCIIMLAVSIISWNKILIYKNVPMDTGRDSSSVLGKQIVLALDYLQLIDDLQFYEIESINNNKYLSDKEKQKLMENPEDYKIISIIRKNEIIEQDLIIIDENGTIKGTEAIKLLLSNSLKHPLLTVSSYTFNYLSISNIVPAITSDGVIYYTSREIDFKYNNEINSIGYRIYRSNPNNFHMPDERMILVDDYLQQSNPSSVFKNIYLLTIPIYNGLFQIIMCLLPFFLLISFILNIKDRKKDNKLIQLSLILLGFSFLHIMVHVVTGAIIDRYAVMTIVPTVLGIIIILTSIINKISKKLRKLNEEVK